MPDAVRIAAGIEYDGGAYHGWQIQRSASSIQAPLQAAFGRIADHPVSLICAGRTDAGVHAREQVAHFDTTAVRAMPAWLLGANAALPTDISVRWVCTVPEHFHARYSTHARTYRYLILNRRARSALAAGRALCVHRPLDASRMHAAVAMLLGEHDFSGFRSAECQSRSPERRLQHAQVTRVGDWVWIELCANAFLHHMARNIVGLLLAVGRGDATPEQARVQLLSRQRSTGEATAPAIGLYFWQAHYPPQFGLPQLSAMIAAGMQDHELNGMMS
jgi:tRNA pseudouridine38-40 synthase